MSKKYSWVKENEMRSLENLRAKFPTDINQGHNYAYYLKNQKDSEYQRFKNPNRLIFHHNLFHSPDYESD